MNNDFSTLVAKNNENTILLNEFIRYHNFIYSNYKIFNKTPSENYYKLNALKKVIYIISNFKNKIISGEQLSHIKGIGKKTIDRIDEIIKTGKLSEIENTEKKIDVVLELSKIRGIGPIKASEFYEEYGIKNIKDLIKKEKQGIIVLTREMKLGIKYNDSLCTQIPRQLIDDFKIFIDNLTKKIDKNYILTICGSYRRGKPFSSDIDILVTNKKLTNPDDTQKYLLPIIELLSKQFIIDNITENPNKHFQGYASFKNIKISNIVDKKIFDVNYNIIRIDIKIIPIPSFYTALLHYTGSCEFNQKLRLHAKSLHMMLNENGLYNSKGEALKINSEEDIFKHLMLKYIPSEKRY